MQIVYPTVGTTAFGGRPLIGISTTDVPGSTYCMCLL